MNPPKQKQFHPYHDYYTILGVDPSASTAEIQGAYQNLIEKSHKQLVGAEQKDGQSREEPISTELLQRAHEVLTSWDLRKAYDCIYKGTPAQRAKAKEEWEKLAPQRAKYQPGYMEGK